ncbi:preprotein translocase subunit SecA [Marinobacter gelidimuriae]|uniref:preprotein translocase subunit SecA n=1 Tax=Marinobacter gelidimuriae TaxID=2739064 RepID=UPI00037EDE55|nr:preprotein translocase subunit SecA [Marinobacter gelidimuriae]
MFTKLATKVFGNKNAREIKRMRKIAVRINELEKQFGSLTDSELQGKTTEFRERLQKGESLDALMPEAFACVREASGRVMGMRHYDVQFVGAVTLHEGRIAEMKTGEGKTLMSTASAYLNALSGKGVHVITVNDYLARRDADWMGKLYNFMGLQVGVVSSGQPGEEKRAAYQADITYGTNNEFGFDYLRDNMAFSTADKVQRGLHFAIVDEVDSILIDESRTPLIISGAAEDSSKMYQAINILIPILEKGEVPEEGDPTGHFTIDEKTRQVELTERGHEKVEQLLLERELLKAGENLYAAANLSLLHHVHSGLRAHNLFQKNVDYIVQDEQVVIVDEHTGRTMPGRRWSEGLHQAIEAKEGVNIHAESQTLASTTFQNYFRLYEKLSGMTGTADTEAFEFRQIYGLDVVVIPPNKPIQRTDYNDLVYLTEEEKFHAIIDEIKDATGEGRPILVGTASIEASERLASLLKKTQIDYKILNAKQHEFEAQIIAQAGRPGAVTIATNMAGRGTDIVLGGNWEYELAGHDNPSDEQSAVLKDAWTERHNSVLEAGGLHIIGTERHESRRIDNQLRGRAGRQGDPGSSRFFLSLEDNLMRIFAPDKVKSLMQAMGMKNGEAIEHRMVTNAIEKSQSKVEGRNFDMRKTLLEYDDVANDQRSVIYDQRNEVMGSDDVSEMVKTIRADVVDTLVSAHIPPQSMPEQWDVAGLEAQLQSELGIDLPVQQWLDEDSKLYEDNLRQKILELIVIAYDAKEAVVGAEPIRKFEKQVFLQVLDTLWKEHLSNMDHLRRGIHLRGYAQKNPKQEFKREAFNLFESMLEAMKGDVIRVLCHVKVQSQEELGEIERQRKEALANELARARLRHDETSATAQAGAGGEAGGHDSSRQAMPETFVRNERKVGRNEPCPCGSGKKFKQCCGKIS